MTLPFSNISTVRWPCLASRFLPMWCQETEYRARHLDITVRSDLRARPMCELEGEKREREEQAELIG